MIEYIAPNLSIRANQQYEFSGITYRYNSIGFRCDELDRDTDVLFIGCSYTEGSCVQQHETWASIVRETVFVDSAYINLAIAAHGIDTAALLTNWYRTYNKKPKYILLLCPPFARRTFRLSYSTAPLGWNPSHPEFTLIPGVENMFADEEYYKFESFKSLSILSSAAELMGSQIVFSGWDCSHEAQLEQEQLLQYFPNITSIPYNVDFLDRGTDGAHPGPLTHRAIAQRFIDFLAKKS